MKVFIYEHWCSYNGYNVLQVTKTTELKYRKCGLCEKSYIFVKVEDPQRISFSEIKDPEKFE